MKKLCSILLAIAMMFSLAACGGSSSDNSTAETSAAPAETTAAEETAEAEAPEAEPEAEAGEDFAAEPTYSFRMSVEAQEGQWLAEMFYDYADDVYNATKGQVEIELFTGNALGGADDVWQQFTTGAIQMSNGGTAHAGDFPVSMIIQTPFVASSPESALEIMQDLEAGGYLSEFTDVMHVCFYMPTLPQEFLLKDKEVTSVEDLSGLILRGNAAPIVAAIEALGSTAESIPIPDLYMSLSQGVVDGSVTSVDAAEVFKLQEVTKYLVDLPICYGLNYAGINIDVWEELPADIQEAIDGVNAQYQEIYMEKNAQAGEDCTKTMVDGGLTVLEPSEEFVADVKAATANVTETLVNDLNSAGFDGEALLAQAQAVDAK